MSIEGLRMSHRESRMSAEGSRMSYRESRMSAEGLRMSHRELRMHTEGLVNASNPTSFLVVSSTMCKLEKVMKQN